MAAGRSGLRAAKGVARREAILAAALEEFSARGFAATRLDDVARRAGIAKGTIYLYFRDKEALFQELIRSMFGPVVDLLRTLPDNEVPMRELAEWLMAMFVREILQTRRKDIVRLIIAEGARFPKLAEFHYREVVSCVMATMTGLLEKAAARGEVRNVALARHPQLLLAPGLLAILWGGLFGRFAPLDVEGLLRTHLDILFGERKTS
jgi:AcrR family transcriptional regulator